MLFSLPMRLPSDLLLSVNSPATVGDEARPFDVLGLGCAAVDDLIYIESFPLPDTKTRVLRRERHCGGLTTTALVAAARLGARCAYAGALGEGELSEFVRLTLDREGVDVRFVPFDAGANPLHATIVVAEREGSRNILLHKVGHTGASDDLPDAALIQRAKVLFLDQFNERGNLRAARLAREAGVPIVADFEARNGDRFSELLGLVDHLILSHGFASELAGTPFPADALERLGARERAATIITVGEQGCWYQGRGDEKARQFPAFRVPVADTTGCGDAFHGAYAAALAWGLDLEERVRLACAVAALKATKSGGQQGLPNRDDVERFLSQEEDLR